jgi:hypothetical protein
MIADSAKLIASSASISPGGELFRDGKVVVADDRDVVGHASTRVAKLVGCKYSIGVRCED